MAKTTGSNPVGPIRTHAFRQMCPRAQRNAGPFGPAVWLFLKMQHKSPKLTVDTVLIDHDSIILVRRKNPPFQGMWALPGGFVEYGETIEEALKRETKEETGLLVEITCLLGVYSDPKRDPRGHTVSIVYLCKEVGGLLAADTDAAEVKRHPLQSLPPLAFDHKKIVEDAINALIK